MIIHAEERFAKRREEIKTAASFERALEKDGLTLEDEGTIDAMNQLTEKFLANFTLFPKDK